MYDTLDYKCCVITEYDGNLEDRCYAVMILCKNRRCSRTTKLVLEECESHIAHVIHPLFHVWGLGLEFSYTFFI